MDLKQNEDIQKFLDKIKQLEKNEKLDLSSDEDLSIGIMNLISIEEHLFFTFSKTGKKEYLSVLNQVREMRKDLLKKIIKDSEGEVWCTCKHLLAASMRLIEVGTKMLGKGNEQEAKDMFEKAYGLYSMFWGINLGLVTVGNELTAGNGNNTINLVSDSKAKTASVSIFAKLGQIVQKAIDCCKE